MFQVMRREGDEQKMKQCQLLNGQHDMIVNSVSTLVVLNLWLCWTHCELKRWWLTAPLWSVEDGTSEQSFG